MTVIPVKFSLVHVRTNAAIHAAGRYVLTCRIEPCREDLARVTCAHELIMPLYF